MKTSRELGRLLEAKKSADPRPDLVDAIAVLTAAHQLHAKHLRDPKSATEESQKKMMDQIVQARQSVRSAFDKLEGR